MFRMFTLAMLSLSVAGEAAAQELPRPLTDGYAWRLQPAPRAGPITGVAVNPADPAIAVAVAADGSAWLTITRGSSWFRVLDRLPTSLGGLSEDEEVYREVEAFFEDMLAMEEIDDVVDDGEEPDVSAVDGDAGRDAAEAARTEVLSGGGITSGQITQEVEIAPRAFFSNDGWLVISRRDGVHVTTNLGGSWSRVLDQPFTDILQLPGRGLWVAGTADGVRFAVDPYAWIDVEDGTEGLYIHDLSADQEGVYAATDDGLWFAPDAQRWSRQGSIRETLYSVETDPDWPLGLWIATANNVRRSDDGGRTLALEVGEGIRSVRDVDRVGPGHLLATGEFGVFESIDGGLTWDRFERGLTNVASSSISSAGDQVWLAGKEGPFLLMQVSTEELLADLRQDVPPWVPVGAIVTRSLSRPGLVSQRGGMRRFVAAYLLPQVRLEGQYRVKQGLRWNDTSGTVRTRFPEQIGRLILQWSPPGRKVRMGEYDGDIDFDSDLDDSDRADVDIVVVDDSVFVGGSAAGYASQVATRRSAMKYRNTLIEDINDIYSQRNDLIRQRTRLDDAALADKIVHELKIQELEATLDVLSDGAVSSWAMAQRTEEP